jgi:hypothetical protein
MTYIGELNPGEYYFRTAAGEECYATITPMDGEVWIEMYDGQLSEAEEIEIQELLKDLVA